MLDAPYALASSMHHTCRCWPLPIGIMIPKPFNLYLSNAEAAHQCKAIVVLAIAHSRQVKSCGRICGVPMPPQTGQIRLGSHPLGPVQICCGDDALIARFLNAGAGDNRLSRGVRLLINHACRP